MLCDEEGDAGITVEKDGVHNTVVNTDRFEGGTLQWPGTSLCLNNRAPRSAAKHTANAWETADWNVGSHTRQLVVFHTEHSRPLQVPDSDDKPPCAFFLRH